MGNPKYSARVALGANRIGKTLQGAYEAVLAVTGRHPYRNFPAEGRAYIVSVSNERLKTIDRPAFEIALPEEYKAHFDAEYNIWHCSNGNRSWEIFLKSVEQGAGKFQGDKLDFIWFDEEPEGERGKKVFSECMMRLVDKGGIWWMTATPILGTAWLKAISEREDVFSVEGSLYENPYIPLEEIKRKEAEYTEDEALVRIYGHYLTFGGRPVFRTYIKDLNARLKQLTSEPPLIGHIESYAA